MTATLLDGIKTAADVRARAAQDAADFTSRAGRKPGLATVLVGDDPASHVYVRGKIKACGEAGIESRHCPLPGDTTQDQLLGLVEELAADDAVDGILVQAPLPEGLSLEPVVEAIPVAKDVDGFHPASIGGLVLGLKTLPTCTPAGVIALLDAYGLSLEGARVVVVGRSNTVGRPLALMLVARHATVTIAHSRTRDLPDLTRQADILVAATGSAGLIGADMVQPGAAVIDVGITRTDEGLRGDVRFDEVREVAGYLTPVPGGVGPMTIAMLMRNTVDAAERRCS